MNIRRIEIFLAVEKHRSFSVAAEKLHIAQSAVSIAVRKLEEELHTRLFHRENRSVELTDTGKLFLSRVRPALAQIALAQQEIQAIDQLAMGHVALAAPAMVAQFALAGPLVDFQVAHPGIQLKILQGGAHEIEDWVRAGDVELAITAQRNFHADLESKVLTRLSNIACMAAASPLAKSQRLSWRELLRQPLVTFPPGYHQRSLIDQQAHKRGITPQIVMEVENVTVLLEAVRRGIGLTTLPAPAVAGIRGVTTVALEEDDVLVVTACYPRGVPLSHATAALLQHLSNALDRSIPKKARRSFKESE